MVWVVVGCASHGNRIEPLDFYLYLSILFFTFILLLGGEGIVCFCSAHVSIWCLGAHLKHNDVGLHQGLKNIGCAREEGEGHGGFETIVRYLPEAWCAAVD